MTLASRDGGKEAAKAGGAERNVKRMSPPTTFVFLID